MTNMSKKPTLCFESVEIDLALARKYDAVGPRYTSYPTVDRFVDEFDATRYRHAIRASHLLQPRRALSLYVHLPFCETDCYYCACNRVITQDRVAADRYLDFLEREVAMQAALFPASAVDQLHLGGGTPTFLTPMQFDRLMGMLNSAFRLAPNAQRTTEIDPRRMDKEGLAALVAHGFNRLSLGVQDLNAQVQAALNRIQPAALTQRVIGDARELGFRSINVDLLYGLPFQTSDMFTLTLNTVRDWRPHRIALYKYIHSPDRIRAQRRIDSATLPAAADQLAMLQYAVRTLLEAGYVYIGMDHFALPDDDLAVAVRQGRLHHNFQGYSTHPDCDLIGLGVSAIGKVGNTYSQNHRELDHYYDAIDRGALPIARGLALSADDILRRAVIQALLCQGELVFEPFETSWMIDFHRYFGVEMDQLEALSQDGLVELDDTALHITLKGKLFARTIAAVFDKYRREAQTAERYSRII